MAACIQVDDLQVQVRRSSRRRTLEIAALALAGEHQPRRFGVGLQDFQNLHGLDGQRDKVGLSVFLAILGALHPRSGDRPQRLLQINFRPCRAAQFTGPLEQHGGQLQGCPHHGAALVHLDGAHQFPQPVGISNGCKVPSPVRGQRAFQVPSNVPVNPPRRHTVAPDLARQHQPPVGCFHGAAFLDSAQRGQQLHGLYIRQPPIAQPGKQVTFKLTLRPHCMGFAPLGLLLFVPLQGHHFETVSCRVRSLQPCQLAHCNGVLPLGLLQLCRIASAPCRRQAHNRIAAQRQPGLLAIAVDFLEPAL